MKQRPYSQGVGVLKAGCLFALINTPTTLDFETEAIEGNPLLDPPRPVGLAVRWPDGEAGYITDWDEMVVAFRKALLGPVLFHNASFDLSVAQRWLGIHWPEWHHVHDTMYLLYLKNPYAKTFSLKPSAEKYLNLPPEEQDLAKEWVMRNVPGAREKNWGTHLSKVPEEILAPYAIGDVVRTYQLFELLYENVPHEPYDRERRLMPILVSATRRGVRLATTRLEQALELYTGAFEQCDSLIRATLQAPGLNPSSGPELAQALDEAGLVEDWVLTPTGQRSTSIKNLRVSDPEVAKMLAYRSSLKTLLGTFITGWLEGQRDGRLHPNWNSTRGDREGGTRTGRLSSSSPNFQNIPNPQDVPAPPGLPELPRMRDYILPEEGHLWLKRDFSAQEIRIAAHFEDGSLAEAFNENPSLDPHQMVADIIETLTGVKYPRKYVKETGFGILYGMGRPALAGRLGITTDEANALMKSYLRALPGMSSLQEGTKRRGRAHKPIKTWGGRLIHVEPPALVKGQMRSFEYKLLNYLIQGSAADQTKQCIIEWDGQKTQEVLMATVHDEINISAPEDLAPTAMSRLKRSMEESCAFDVPMLSQGFIGLSWGEVGDE